MLGKEEYFEGWWLSRVIQILSGDTRFFSFCFLTFSGCTTHMDPGRITSSLLLYRTSYNLITPSIGKDIFCQFIKKKANEPLGRNCSKIWIPITGILLVAWMYVNRINALIIPLHCKVNSLMADERGFIPGTEQSWHQGRHRSSSVWEDAGGLYKESFWWGSRSFVDFLTFSCFV